MDGRAAGSSPTESSASVVRSSSSEDVMDDLLSLLVGLPLVVEATRLEVVHGVVAAAACHQLVVGAELEGASVLDHADEVGLTHRGEPVGHQDRGRVGRRLFYTAVYLGVAADVEH